MANYMSDNKTEEIHEYSIIGKDLTTFILQPGFVEGVIRQNKIFSQIENDSEHLAQSFNVIIRLLFMSISRRIFSWNGGALIFTLN